MLIILSGPSGVGKTTLASYLLNTFSELQRVITYTTRPPRPGEISGKDYHFMSEKIFQMLELGGAFIEKNYFNGHWYATPNDFIPSLQHGAHWLVIPDVNGAQKLKMAVPSATAIWITAPSEVLRARLRARRSEDSATQEERLKRALIEEKEARASGMYQHILVNEDLETAKEELSKIVRSIIF